MKPHTVISCIYQPLLREMLEQQGAHFISDDFSDTKDFLAELRVTEASHAIAHITVLEPRYRKELQAIRKVNPSIHIIIIASVGTLKDKKLMEVFTEHDVRVVADDNRSLVSSIIKIIDETAETITNAITDQGEASPPPPPPQPEWDEGNLMTDKAKPTLPALPLIKPSLPKIKLPKLSKPARAISEAPPDEESNLAATIPSQAIPEDNTTAAIPVVQSAQAPPEQKPAKQKKLRLQKPTVPIVIPIYSGSHGAGCTWLAVQIATYIAAHGFNVTVCGATDLLLMNKHVRAGDTHFSVKGVDFNPYAKPPDLISAGYDYIIFDVGLIMDFEPDNTPYATANQTDMMEVMRAPHKIMVADTGLWRQNALYQILTKSVWRQLADASVFAISSRSSKSAISTLTSRYNAKFVHLPQAESFELSAEVVAAVEQLLSPLYK